MKIWLDDCRPCPYPDWTVVNTVVAAKELFLNNEVEDASFDNDLGNACNNGCYKEVIDEALVGYLDKWGYTEVVDVCDRKICTCTCHDEGYMLIDWLEETGKWPKNKPTVHSSNAARALYMRSVINKHYGVGECLKPFQIK